MGAASMATAEKEPFLTLVFDKLPANKKFYSLDDYVDWISKEKDT